MPRKKVVKEPLEKVKDEVVLEIIEDSSDEEPPPPPEKAIRVTKGKKVISDMSVDDVKEQIAPKSEKKKRVMTDEQKAKMKAGRERKKAEKALQASKQEKKPAPIITTNLSPPPVEEPPVPKEEEMPSWFKSYLNTQKKPEPEPVKTAPAKKPRGRPKGKKDSQPRVKKQSNADLEEVQLAAPKKSMRFI